MLQKLHGRAHQGDGARIVAFLEGIERTGDDGGAQAGFRTKGGGSQAGRSRSGHDHVEIACMAHDAGLRLCRFVPVRGFM